jgi:hypothetical protein
VFLQNANCRTECHNLSHHVRRNTGWRFKHWNTDVNNTSRVTSGRHVTQDSLIWLKIIHHFDNSAVNIEFCNGGILNSLKEKINKLFLCLRFYRRILNARNIAYTAPTSDHLIWRCCVIKMMRILDTVHLLDFVINTQPLGKWFNLPSAGDNRSLISLGPLDGANTYVWNKKCVGLHNMTSWWRQDQCPWPCVSVARARRTVSNITYGSVYFNRSSAWDTLTAGDISHHCIIQCTGTVTRAHVHSEITGHLKTSLGLRGQRLSPTNNGT